MPTPGKHAADGHLQFGASYELVKQLGAGSFGVVYQGIMRTGRQTLLQCCTGEQLAVKVFGVVEDGELCMHSLAGARREMALARCIRSHPALADACVEVHGMHAFGLERRWWRCPRGRGHARLH